MTTSKLQEGRKQRGDVKVFAMDNTYRTGVFVPLEDLIKARNFYTLVGNGI